MVVVLLFGVFGVAVVVVVVLVVVLFGVFGVGNVVVVSSAVGGAIYFMVYVLAAR